LWAVTCPGGLHVRPGIAIASSLHPMRSFRIRLRDLLLVVMESIDVFCLNKTTGAIWRRYPERINMSGARDNTPPGRIIAFFLSRT